jgi:hypothetical protein
MEERPGRRQVLRDIAIVFSFVVNLILVLALLLMIGPIFRAKSGFVEPLLTDLDQAFLGLSETDIKTTVAVEQSIPISFTLPLSQPMGLDFNLPIDQETTVVLNRAVPLTAPATFVFPNSGGAIHGTVSLDLPAGLPLPVQLTMDVPVQTEIPVHMDVPVNEMVAIEMEIPVTIQLGEAGLDPAVETLRRVFAPLRHSVEELPDGLDEIIR